MANSFLKIDTERVFNIKKSELQFVKILFLHNFFQGFALALFFTSANAIFLSAFSVTKLPLVYILSSVVLLGVGYGYSYLEEHISNKKLLNLAIIILVISSLFIWLGLKFITFAWMGFVIIICYRINNLLSNLEFWGISSIMFDVRQSKRLFGIISSGEVTAKLLGYLTVPVIVGKIGNTNIILIAAISFAISYFFLQRIFKIDKRDTEKKPETGVVENTERESILKKYFKSDFIILLSILSFLSIIAFTFIDFSFLTNVQKEFKSNEEQLAIFLGYFFAFSKGITFLVKLFFTGRLIDLLGMKRSLLLLPILFIAITLTIIFYSFTYANSQNLIFLFGFMMLIQEIFRYSLHEPVFFSLFQPLQKKLRLFGQAVVNGLLNPLALGVTGLILVLITNTHQSINLNLISYLLFAVLVCWIITAIFSNRQYIIVLQNAVNKRLFEGSEIAVKGKAIHDILKARLLSKYPEEVIYSTELLIKMDQNKVLEVLLSLLKHPSEEVKLYALTKIEEYKIKRLKQAVFDIIQDESSSRVKENAIKAYCVIDEFAVERINPLLEDKNTFIRKGAISGLLKNGGLEAVVLSGQQLLNLINSDKDEEKIIAAEIMGELQIKNFYQPIIKFFQHNSVAVIKSAIDSSAYIQNEKFIPFLIAFLKEKEYHEKASHALIEFGELAIDAIEKEYKKKDIDTGLIYRFCQICGKIGGPKAHNLLIEFLEYPSAKIQYEAISALKKASYKAYGNERMIREKFDAYFGKASWMFQAISLFNNENKSDILIKALSIEIEFVKENLFNILSFLYDTRTIFKAKEGLLQGFGEKQANALEIIDNLISKKMSSKFSVILEDLPLEERVKKLGSYPPIYQLDQHNVIQTILTKQEEWFNRWTQVTAIQFLENNTPGTDQYPLLKNYININDKILRESACFAIWGLMSKKQLDTNLANQIYGEENLKKIMKTTQNTDHLLLDIEKVIILKSTSLFTETPENILVDVANIVQEERIEEGTTIFNKGDMGYCMYIINEGEIRIHDDKLTFAVLKNRDFFGELALLDPEPRSASATALKDSLLLRLDQDAFYELMSERMEVAKGILKILCRRIREQNDRIIKLKSQKIS